MAKTRIEHRVIDGIECKHCTKCGEWKPLSEFNKNKNTWDGIDFWCKECGAKNTAKWYQDNREEILEKNKQYRDKHKEEISKRHKQHYADNIELMRLRAKEHRNTIVGTAKSRLRSYIAEDRKHSRIGNELPKDYVTLSDVLRIMTKRCKHCGKVGWRKVGLNRLDDFLPHIKSNVEPCCQSCNKKKPRPTRKRNTELRKQHKQKMQGN